MAASLSPRLLALLLALSHITVVAAAAPLAPAAGGNVVQQGALVSAELQRALEEDDAPQVVTLRSFVDAAAGIRVYLRDGQLLFAISTTRNITAAEKWNGERTAASLARQVLKEEFAALDADGGFQNLDARAVRVVLIEPEAFAPLLGAWPYRNGGLNGAMGTTGGGSCGGGRFFGDGKTPIPFAPAGYWAGGAATPAPCVGCR